MKMQFSSTAIFADLHVRADLYFMVYGQACGGKKAWRDGGRERGREDKREGGKEGGREQNRKNKAKDYRRRNSLYGKTVFIESLINSA